MNGSNSFSQVFAWLDRSTLSKAVIAFLTVLLLGVWLLYTPGGLLGKADAVGYAVCHRISERSFMLGDRPLPLCARCSGMFLGALVGLVYQTWLGRGRRPAGGLPHWKFLLVFGALLAAFAVDGVNSYLHFFPNAPELYEPNNILRLLTGTGVGLGIAAVLFPTVNQTLWSNWEDRPVLSGWRHLAALLALAAGVDLLLLSQNPIFLYPLALASAFTVLVILTAVYTVIWAFITKKENLYTSVRSAGFIILAGFITALIQVSAFDFVRFYLTGTWSGIVPGA